MNGLISECNEYSDEDSKISLLCLICIFQVINQLVTKQFAEWLNVLFEQVLRILEGDMLMDATFASPGYDVGDRSGKIWSDQQQHHSGSLVDEALEGFSGKVSLDGRRSGTCRRTSCQDDL